MEKSDLKDRTMNFSIQVSAFVVSLSGSSNLSVVSRQLLRSATSVGANYRAACRAKSRRDFINKLKIVEEETDESLFWMEFLVESRMVKPGRLDTLIAEARELLAIIVASLKTARKNGLNKGEGQTNGNNE